MVKRQRTNNTMVKRKRTHNTMVKRKRTHNTMVKRKRTNNTMVKRKKTHNTKSVGLEYPSAYHMFLSSSFGQMENIFSGLALSDV
jgi:hypothetical protein